MDTIQVSDNTVFVHFCPFWSLIVYFWYIVGCPDLQKFWVGPNGTLLGAVFRYPKSIYSKKSALAQSAPVRERFVVYVVTLCTERARQTKTPRYLLNPLEYKAQFFSVTLWYPRVLSHEISAKSLNLHFSTLFIASLNLKCSAHARALSECAQTFQMIFWYLNTAPRRVPLGPTQNFWKSGHPTTYTALPDKLIHWRQHW